MPSLMSTGYGSACHWRYRGAHFQSHPCDPDLHLCPSSSWQSWTALELLPSNILLGQPVAATYNQYFQLPPLCLPYPSIHRLPSESSLVSLSWCSVLTSHGKPILQTPMFAATNSITQSIPHAQCPVRQHPSSPGDFCIEANLHPNHNGQTPKRDGEGMLYSPCPGLPRNLYQWRGF